MHSYVLCLFKSIHSLFFQKLWILEERSDFIWTLFSLSWIICLEIGAGLWIPFAFPTRTFFSFLNNMSKNWSWLVNSNCSSRIHLVDLHLYPTNKGGNLLDYHVIGSQSFMEDGGQGWITVMQYFPNESILVAFRLKGMSAKTVH